MIMAQLQNKDNCVNGAGVLDESSAHGRDGVNPEHHQIVNQQSGTDATNSILRIGSLNVGTMRGRSGEVIETLERRKVDVCCVQEIRWRGASTRLITGKSCQYKMFWVGNNRGVGGVGILVHQKWIESIVDVKRVNDRLMMIKILIDKRVISIVSVYAPQQGLSAEEKDRFYEEVISLISRIDDKDFLVIGGDFNGHVGEKADGYQGVHGGFGFGTRNLEGERILELGAALDLKVCNTFFKKRESRLITYKSGPHHTQIDYFLVKGADLKTIKDVKVIGGEEVAQQHQLLICDLVVPMGKKKKKCFVSKRKVWKLKDNTTKEEFENLFRDKSGQPVDEATVEDLWTLLKNDLLETSNVTCGWTKGPPRHKVTWWWNNEVDTLIRAKRELWKEWKRGGSKEQYLIAKKAARRGVYNAKKRAEEERFGEVLRREDQREEVFKIAKQMAAANKDVVGDKCVRNDKGFLATSEKDKHQAWQEHYERLLNEEFDWDKDNLIVNDPMIGPPPEIDEESVRQALNKMKKGKASGVSGVVSEMLSASGDAGITRLTKLFNQIIAQNQIPDDWNTSIIVNCFKNKGEAVERGNYRGLKLLEHTMKVFERVIETKIREMVNVDSMQFGFMPGKGTVDAIFIARQLQELHLQKNKELYFAFVDLEKAFDRVPRDIVNWALRKLGVEEWLVRTVMAMYENSASTVRINNTTGKKFGVKVGVHQGSVLSPLLFVIVLEALSRECRVGVPWEMLYADDLVIVAKTLEELETRYSAWKNSMESKGLRINLDKTKVMLSGVQNGPVFSSGQYPCAVCCKGVASNSIFCTYCNKWVHKRCSGITGNLTTVKDFKCRTCSDPSPDNDKIKSVELNGTEYEVVDQFCYLGDMLSAGGGAEASTVARVRSGWKKFRELLPLLTSRIFSHKVKGRLYTACVRSAMLYGSETWPLKQEDIDRLVRTDMQMVRWMCNVSLRDRKSSEELRNRLHIPHIANVLRQKRLRWYGHMERMADENPVRQVLLVEVDGRRKRGRPRKTWQELVRTDLNQLNLQPGLAQDREAWKRATK